MIRHIVLLAFKTHLSDQEIQQIFLAIGSLANTIPQIHSYSWGKSNSPENLNKQFTHGFCMEFANEHDRAIYLAHADHKELVEIMIIPSLADGMNSALVFDYTL